MDTKNLTRDAILKGHRPDWLRREQAFHDKSEHPKQLSDAELREALTEDAELDKPEHRSAAGVPTTVVRSLGANAVLREAPPKTVQDIQEQNARRMRRRTEDHERLVAEAAARDNRVKTLDSLATAVVKRMKPKRKPRGAKPLTTDYDIAAAEIIRRSRDLSLEGLCWKFREEKLGTPLKLREKKKYKNIPGDMVDAYDHSSIVPPQNYHKVLSNWRENFERRIASLDARTSNDSIEVSPKKSAKTAKSAAKRRT